MHAPIPSKLNPSRDPKPYRTGAWVLLIQYAECDKNCNIPDCPYIHSDKKEWIYTANPDQYQYL